MRMMTYLSCALAGIFLASHPQPVRADDDLEDYYEDLKDAREDYYEDLEDYYEDLEDHQRDQARRGYYGSGYAVEPYWSYPQEYYIFGGHPSRYYYTYPDRYYSQKYQGYRSAPQYRSYGYQRDPNIWRHDVYGYRRPFWENDLRRNERRDRDFYRYYDENERYRNDDRGGYERRYRR